jgi:hypothetical protein
MRILKDKLYLQEYILSATLDRWFSTRLLQAIEFQSLRSDGRELARILISPERATLHWQQPIQAAAPGVPGAAWTGVGIGSTRTGKEHENERHGDGRRRSDDL